MIPPTPRTDVLADDFLSAPLDQLKARLNEGGIRPQPIFGDAAAQLRQAVKPMALPFPPAVTASPQPTLAPANPLETAVFTKPVEVRSYKELGRYTNLDRPVLLKVGASWCGPCKQSAPAAEQYAATGDAIVVLVDAELVPEVNAWLNITSVPHWSVVRKNQILRSDSGAKLHSTQIASFVGRR